MEDQTYTIPEPMIETPYPEPQMTETAQEMPSEQPAQAPVEAQEMPADTTEQTLPQQATEPSDTAQTASADTTEQVSAEEAPVAPSLATCASCGSTGELFDVPHHQSANATVWHYCARCKAAHEREIRVVEGLRELALTHPAQADTPRVAGMLHQGTSVEDVKAELDRERQPELEAEVVV